MSDTDQIEILLDRIEETYGKDSYVLKSFYEVLLDPAVVIKNSQELTRCFLWMNDTKRGSDFWAKVHIKLEDLYEHPKT